MTLPFIPGWICNLADNKMSETGIACANGIAGLSGGSPPWIIPTYITIK
jgi:hypothetical protein